MMYWYVARALLNAVLNGILLTQEGALHGMDVAMESLDPFVGH